MLSYFLERRRNTESKNPKVVMTKNGRIMLLPKFSVCNGKILNFLKKQEARGLLSNLIGVKISILSDLPLLNALFYYFITVNNRKA